MRETFDDRLVDYLAGELTAEEEAAFEEALFTTPAVGQRVAATLGIGDGVAGIAGALGGALAPVMSPARLEALRARGVRVLEVALQPGEVLTEPIPAGVDFLVGRLTLPAEHAGPVDVQFVGGQTAPTTSRAFVSDAPWDPKTRTLSIVCERHVAERDPVTCFRVVRSNSDEVVAEYTVRLPGRP